jgi:hypothetical protein
MLNSELNLEECDATGDNSSNEVGLIKIFRTILIFKKASRKIGTPSQRLPAI